MPSDLDKMLAMLAGKAPAEPQASSTPKQADPQPEAEGPGKGKPHKPRRQPQARQEAPGKPAQAESPTRTPEAITEPSERAKPYGGGGVDVQADAERQARGLPPLTLPDWDDPRGLLGAQPAVAMPGRPELSMDVWRRACTWAHGTNHAQASYPRVPFLCDTNPPNSKARKANRKTRAERRDSPQRRAAVLSRRYGPGQAALRVLGLPVPSQEDIWRWHAERDDAATAGQPVQELRRHGQRWARDWVSYPTQAEAMLAFLLTDADQRPVVDGALVKGPEGWRVDQWLGDLEDEEGQDELDALEAAEDRAADAVYGKPKTPTPTQTIQQEIPTGPGSKVSEAPVTPKRKRKAAAKKPPKPVTPNPFRDHPAPEPVDVALVSTTEGLQHLVDRWLEAPPERIGLDTETTGLSPLLGARIRLVQLMAEGEETVFVVDTWAVGNDSFQQLSPLFSLSGTEFVAHNAAFEVEHLAAAGIRMRAPVRCTLLAAWLLSRGVLPTQHRVNAKGSGLDLASCCGRMLQLDVSKTEQTSDWAADTLTESQLQYAALDSWLTLKLWGLQREALQTAGMVKVHQVESMALPAVAEARLTGLTLDLQEAKRLAGQREDQLVQLQEKLHSQLGVENLNSTRQVAEAVTSRGHELPTTEAGNLQVSEDVLRPLYDVDKDLVPIKEARATGKDLRTYLRNWVELAEADTAGRIRPQLRSNGASTGRMTCPKGELPKPTTLQGAPTAMRHLFVAAPGHVLVDGDWSAIEHRLAAAIYGEEAYVRIYTEGLDPHCYTASAIYGREITKEADPEARAVGKTANFAMGYGCGPRKVRELLSQAQGREVSLQEAYKVCDGWDAAYPALAERRNRYRKREPWEVKSALGRVMADKLLTKGEPGVHHSGAEARRIRSTNALAWPIQSSGAELLKEAVSLLMPRLWDELPGARLAHLVHDEILLEVPEHLADQAAAVLLEVMQDPDLEARYLQGVLPLVAEVKVGRTWAETH